MSDVKFGWRIPSFPVDDSKAPKFIGQIMNSLKEVDGHFDSFWICDHFIPFANFVSRSTDTLEAWTTLCYLAGVFKKPHFGNIVLCNSYRNPALLAKMGALISVLTGGRFILGIGAGWYEDEYLSYGYEFAPADVRIRQLEEGVQIIRKMWTDETVNFKGKYYRVKDVYCDPKPDPVPPIMIGGGGEKLTLRVVARHADWWNLPGGTLDNYRNKLNILEKHCSKVGRDFYEIKKTWGAFIAIAEDKEKANRIASSSKFYKSCVGTPEDVIVDLEKFIEEGVEHFIIKFLDFPNTEGSKLFAEEVIPQLK